MESLSIFRLAIFSLTNSITPFSPARGVSTLSTTCDSRHCEAPLVIFFLITAPLTLLEHLPPCTVALEALSSHPSYTFCVILK
jgi:hypothetical protein